MQVNMSGQDEEEQSEAMTAMVATQAWDDNGPPWNAPMGPGESIAFGEESTERQVSRIQSCKVSFPYLPLVPIQTPAWGPQSGGHVAEAVVRKV